MFTQEELVRIENALQRKIANLEELLSSTDTGIPRMSREIIEETTQSNKELLTKVCIQQWNAAAPKADEPVDHKEMIRQVIVKYLGRLSQATIDELETLL